MLIDSTMRPATSLDVTVGSEHFAADEDFMITQAIG
jgi:hypothetical protein